MDTCLCICIYTYMYTSLSLSPYFSLYVYNSKYRFHMLVCCLFHATSSELVSTNV